MLKFYFSTSVIWLIINLSLIMFYREKIMANGWVSNFEPNRANLVASLLMISVVPIIRMVMPIATILMAAYTPEEYEEWTNKNKREK